MASLLVSTRRLRPEVMDQPQLGAAEHIQALRGLRRLNLASGVAATLWREINRRLRPASGKPLRLLDIASGGGDVPLSLWARAQKRCVQLEILGLDKSSTACDFAAARAQRDHANVTFQQHDVLNQSIPGGFDIVTCSLFLHHLEPGEVVRLLSNLAAAAQLIVVSDLRRNLRGYVLAHAASWLLTTSRVVHADAPQSVANAFSIAEMRRLCHEAGLHDAMIRKTWPCRMLIVCHKETTRD
jgi:2-polyprenyl-3-methyl-5-hydroxy-6-metoxy-1,4-benzoquinol methylase